MNLFSPWSLLWLLPVVGGIIILWMLRLRRQELTVSSLHLWRAMLQESQANAPFQKLRRHLLLFLQLLAAFLLIFALARPFVYGQGLAGRSYVLILDTSASMNAKDVRPSRLEAAKADAENFLQHEMTGSDVATVIAAGARPVTQTGFTGDKERLQNAVHDTNGTDAVADMAAALMLAQSLVGDRSGAQIRIFSDGAYAPDEVRRLGRFTFGATEVRQSPVGSVGADNVAITAMDGRRNPVTGRNEVFVEVQNLGHRSAAGGTLSLLQDGRLIAARSLTLLPAGESETFDDASLAQGGVITARLDDITDDLAVDNQASIVLPAPRKRRILLVSSGNLFLERGLNLDPEITLDECAPGEFATLGKRGAGYALVVFDGVLPPGGLPPGNYLTFDVTGAQTPFVAAKGKDGTSEFVDQNHTHPVMRFVDLSGVRIRKALPADPAPWGQSLADGSLGPLIAAGETDGRRVVSVSFDLSDSDWPLRVSFPIFLSNAIQWLTAGSQLGAASTQTPTGGVASLVVPPGLQTLTITLPDGRTDSIKSPASGGVVAYDHTTEAGIYHARTASGVDYPFCVDLLSRDESALSPRQQAALNHQGPGLHLAAIPLAKRARQDLWPIVAALALTVLALEWLVFHRRIS